MHRPVLRALAQNFACMGCTISHLPIHYNTHSGSVNKICLQNIQHDLLKLKQNQPSLNQFKVAINEMRTKNDLTTC